MADGKVIIETGLDPSGLEKGLTSLPNRAGIKKALVKTGGIIATAFSVKALVNFGKQAVNLASDIEEVQNVVDTAFGDMAYKMEKFSDSAIEMYGISKLTAKQTGSNYMAMAKGLGVATEFASDMALELTALSADMSSFYNVSQDVAATALKSVFTGETESLKRYGIVMTEANLSAFALSQGVTKAYNAMSQAEKVELRYAYVMQQTSLAHGDFKDTQESWANQTRILSERWKEFLSLVGNGLIQILTPALNALNQFVSYLIVITNKLSAVLGIKPKANEAVKSIDGITASTDDLTKSTEALNEAVNKSLGKYDKLNVINKDSGASSASGGGGGLGLSVDSIISDAETSKTNANLGAMMSKFTEFVGSLENVQGALDNFKMIFGDVWNIGILPYLNNLQTIALPILVDFANRTGLLGAQISSDINELVEKAWVDVARPALIEMSEISTDVYTDFKELYDKYAEPVFDGFSKSLDALKENWSYFYEVVLGPIIRNIQENFKRLWDSTLRPIFKNVGELLGELMIMLNALYQNVLSPIARYLTITFGPIFTTIFNAISNTVATVIEAIGGYLNGCITSFKGIIQFLTGVFTLDWKKAWEGIKTAFKGSWESIVAILKSSVNLILGFINAMTDGFEGGINGLVKAINKLKIDVPSWVPEIGGKKWGFNLSKVSFPHIPYLASGAVLPPNNPFMAVVGDQKHGTNIEAPLDTIVKAFKEAQGDGTQEIILNIDGDRLFNWTVKKNNEYKRRYGNNAYA